MPPAADLGDQVALTLESLLIGEASLRCSITWAGEDYPCSAGPERDEDRLDSVGGGYKIITRVQVKVRNEVFPEGGAVPGRGQTIVYKKNASAPGRIYRIAKVADYYGAYMELDCESPSRSA